MIKYLTFLICGLFLGQVCHAQISSDLKDHRIIIKFKKANNTTIKLEKQTRFDSDVLNMVNEDNDLQSVRLTGNRRKADTYLLILKSDKPTEELIESYLRTDLFEYVEPDYQGGGHGVAIIPDDTHFSRQWPHLNDGTFSLSNATEDADMDTDLAWDISVGNPDLVIAILDSGMKLNHSEVSGRIWTNDAETEDGLDSDDNGFNDDVRGWDFANEDNDPKDDHGHGSNVGGIAVASGDNGTGYAGMNWNSQIMILKILDKDNLGFYSWWAEAVYYAVDNGADVINMSVGGDDLSTMLLESINYAYENNVPVIVSSGNGNTGLQYPSKHEQTFAIGSTNSDDLRSVPFFWNEDTGSNFGPELDFVAPGNFIYGLSYQSNVAFGSYWGGTSQAAPHVTGLVSLLLSVNPDLTVDEIRTILEETSEDQVGNEEDTPGWDPYYGHGRINAYEALASIMMPVNTNVLKEGQVTIYPNPVSGQQSLEVENLVAGDYSILIYNNLGQRLYSEKKITVNDKIIVYLPELTTGYYFLKVNNETNNTSTIEKIVVD